MSAVLEVILRDRRRRIEADKAIESTAALEARVRPRASGEPLRTRLLAGPPAFVCEVKVGSPSKGRFAASRTPVELADAYANAGADAVSVVTEPDHFFAPEGLFASVRERVTVPLLMKDFFVDRHQLLRALDEGADVILLIVKALTQRELAALLTEAHALGLEALVEVHDASEATRAVEAGARLLGINNRDLRTFEVRLGTTEAILPTLPAGLPVVAESGIHTPADVARLRAAGASGFLVGESLITHPDPAALLAAFRSAVTA